jgi:hypothetical protein
MEKTRNNLARIWERNSKWAYILNEMKFIPRCSFFKKTNIRYTVHFKRNRMKWTILVKPNFSETQVYCVKENVLKQCFEH